MLDDRTPLFTLNDDIDLVEASEVLLADTSSDGVLASLSWLTDRMTVPSSSGAAKAASTTNNPLSADPLFAVYGTQTYTARPGITAR